MNRLPIEIVMKIEDYLHGDRAYWATKKSRMVHELNTKILNALMGNMMDEMDEDQEWKPSDLHFVGSVGMVDFMRCYWYNERPPQGARMLKRDHQSVVEKDPDVRLWRSFDIIYRIEWIKPHDYYYRL